MMRLLNNSLALTAAAAGLAFAVAAGSARADIKDYEFQLLQEEVKAGDGAVVAVRLLNRKTSTEVPGAVIVATRLDMAPDNMAGMATPLEPLTTLAPGIYRFKTNLTMPGRWQLSLTAKLQGETDSLDSKLVLKAVP